jgi:hypothetical protein
MKQVPMHRHFPFYSANSIAKVKIVTICNFSLMNRHSDLYWKKKINESFKLAMNAETEAKV